MHNGQIRERNRGYKGSFLDKGTEDVERLISLLREYKMEAPVETKMIYDVKTGIVSTSYRYANEIPEMQDDAYDSDYVMRDWEEELKAQYEK